ncbi:MAG TPA: SpoIID/LytB domain-containing protein [Thermodesulfovibrionales bacterium]|nr:SpoIID/LytB domain-containing protein [Thermodesulfovibrionales bacterium]
MEESPAAASQVRNGKPVEQTTRRAVKRRRRFSPCRLFFIVACLTLFPCVLGMPSRGHAENSTPKIKVLVLDETHAVVPDKDEKIIRLGSRKGDLLMNGMHYTGNIEVWKGDKGLYIVNELLLEEYVESVVASEVGTNWEMEALKAQAVIARTYAAYRMNASGSSKYHITSSVLHQVYKGNNAQIQVAYAVKETAGEIITYDGKPIEAFYHSTSGGMTEDPKEVFGKSFPYLKPIETKCEQSPYWLWERKIPFQEIDKALNLTGIKEISVTSLTTTGRVRDLSIESQSGRITMKATQFRKLLGWSRLPSTDFHMTMNGDSVIFEGKGYGHGVGLCQWSALQMAKDGKSYREILSYFYPGTEIQHYEGD